MKIFNNCYSNTQFGMNNKHLSNVVNKLENKSKTIYPAIQDFFVKGETVSISPEVETEIIKHMDEYSSLVSINEGKAVETSKHIYLNV